MRFYLINVLLLLLSYQSYAQDIIHKKDERIIAGQVLKIDSTHIFYKEITDLKGPTLKIEKSEVDHISFDYSPKAQKQRKLVHTRLAKNAIYFAMGGSVGGIGLKYDRVIYEHNNFFLNAGIGIGSLLPQNNINTHLSCNWNLGGNPIHNLELGLGLAIAVDEWNNPNTFFNYKYYVNVPTLGYRLQIYEGIMLRTYAGALMMFDNPMGDRLVIPTLALDLGFSF